MLVSRILSRVSRSAGLRSSLSSAVNPTRNQIPLLSGRFHSLVHGTSNKLAAAPVSLLNHATLDLNIPQKFSFFSSSSAESKENESNTDVPKNGEVSEDAAKASGEAKEWSQSLYITLVRGLPGTRKLHRRTLESGKIA